MRAILGMAVLATVSASAAMAEERPTVRYALITVTGTAEVNYSHGYTSLHMCEEAKSLARTGRTIEQLAEDKKQADKDAKLEEERLAKLTRKPSNSVADQNLMKYPGSSHVCGSSPYDKEEYFDEKDRMIHTQHVTCYSWSSGPDDLARELKIAECIVDDSAK